LVVTVVFPDPPFELITSVVFILMSDPSPAIEPDADIEKGSQKLRRSRVNYCSRRCE